MFLAPAGNVWKGIIPRIQIESSTNTKSTAFGFNFFCHTVFFDMIRHHNVFIMKKTVGTFMNCSFHGLALAHAFIDNNFFCRIVVISLCSIRNLIESNRYCGYSGDCFHEYFIILNTGCQLLWHKKGQWFSLCLLISKYGSWSESWDNNLHLFQFRMSIFTNHRLLILVLSFSCLFSFHGCRSNDRDSFFPSFYLPAKRLPSFI